jgi:hypothetical protein
MTPHDSYAARYSADPADPSQAERLAAYSAGWDDRARTAASCAGWQPIETAPAGTEDGILICTEGFPGSTEEVFWHDGSECYGHRGEAGWFSESDRGNLLTASNAHGTHWMPLPAAPGAPANSLLADVPEGCTPTDARVLREANHALAIEVHELREALSTPLAAVAKADMVMVPREPTEAMVRACMRNDQGGLMTPEYRKAVYRAMVAAATSHPTPKE